MYDKFHVLRHVNEALDETCRAECFRKGGAARGLLRGERWLLRRWADLEHSECRLRKELLALNRRLAKAHLLKEQLAHLGYYTDEGAALPDDLAARPSMATLAGLPAGGPAPPPASRRHPRRLPREGALRRGRGH